MGFGYKHFSHPHNLEKHEMPKGAEVSCSGCNSPATQTIYICWQCNFFLHEQCFQATRSRKHPSHPLHPLTLVPYPTYPSNSFYCNSCKIKGTGFSYSCSDCDFDLHVQCAYSISDSTNSHQPNHVTSTHSHNISYPNHEIAPPHIHRQNSSMVHNIAHNSTPSTPIHAQYPTTVTQDPYMAQNVSQFSIPPSAQNLTASSQNAYVSQNFMNSSTSSQNSFIPQYPTVITQDSYMGQKVSPFSVPTSAQNMYASQKYASVPTSAQNSSIPQYPTGISQDPGMNKNFSQYPATSPQMAYASQNNMNVPTSAQNISIPHNITNNFVSSAPEQPSYYEESGQKISKNQGIIHFSHPHGLTLVNIKHRKKKITCSGCQEALVGKGYACVEENCGFQLDESCFNLEKEIRHKSHPVHPLSLLSSSPYKNANGIFTCNACFKDGIGFCYHCSICQHDLHVKCANLKETVKRDDHQHVLKLCYECPLKGEDYTFYCDVCNRVVPREHWTYYCQDCEYGTHLDCVDREECNESSGDPNADAGTNEQMLLKTEIEAARISAISRKNMLDNV